MSVNAFLDAFNGVQNALGDPRGDARRRAQEDAQNAMVKTRFEQEQAQYRAQQAEKDRMEALNRARFNFRTQRGYGQPMPKGQQMPPQGQMKPPMPSQEDEITFLMRDAFGRGDATAFNQLFDQKRQTMSEKEKMGRQQIATVAGQILQLPPAQRGQAVMQALKRLGIDPADVAIDDYVNDPAQLEQALRFEMALGSPEDAMKENIRVQGTFDQFRPYERQDLGNRVGVFDPRTGQFGQGPSIGLSPNTAATTSTQLQTARIGANSRVRAADLNRQAAAAMAAAGGKIELVPADDLPDGE